MSWVEVEANSAYSNEVFEFRGNHSALSQPFEGILGDPMEEATLEENLQLTFVIDLVAMLGKELFKGDFRCVDLGIVATRWFECLSVI